MKVLLLNGSPNKNGCTNAALTIVADELKNRAWKAKSSGSATDPCAVA